MTGMADLLDAMLYRCVAVLVSSAFNGAASHLQTLHLTLNRLALVVLHVPGVVCDPLL